MRKRQTFLLTILADEDDDISLRGKIKVISSGKTCTFGSAEELYRLISTEMDEESVQHIPACEAPVRTPMGKQLLSS